MSVWFSSLCMSVCGLWVCLSDFGLLYMSVWFQLLHVCLVQWLSGRSYPSTFPLAVTLRQAERDLSVTTTPTQHTVYFLVDTLAYTSHGQVLTTIHNKR